MNGSFAQENAEKVLVVTSSNPEVDWLAAQLCTVGVLQLCVRRYAYLSRWWEKLLQNLPLVKRYYSATFGRRKLPPGLTPEKVADAGIFYDFVSAVFQRSKGNRFLLKASVRMSRMRSMAIASKGEALVGSARVAVANYGVALPVFQRIKKNGGRTVLNYPNAHHRFQVRLLREEAEREPEWADTFTTEITDNAEIFDQECIEADVILVGSSFVKRTFEAEGLNPGKIKVVPYGCDVSLFRPRQKEKSDKFRVLFVGQLTQRKGLSYLLKAYSQFRGHGTELVLAGRQVGNPEVLKSYRHLFEWVGNLPHSRLAEMYSSADVFVFPTLLEGLPLAVLEAMASGVPIIATNHGPGDIVRDGIDGFIVPIRDPEAIANRLEYLRANPELRRTMGMAACQRAQDFTWDQYCQKTAAIVMHEIKLSEQILEEASC
jgi:glycosyltransferase involved in cell wall biosynthesis